MSTHFIIVDESLARIEAPHLLRDPSDGFQMRSAEISTEPEFVLRWAQAFNRDFGHGKPVALDPVLGPTVKPATGLEGARAATKPLQRKYGITVAVIAALIVVVALAPLPTPIVTGVGSALLLATVCVAFRWHVEVSRVLKTVRRRTSDSVD